MDFLSVSNINITQGSFSLKDVSFSLQQSKKLAITGETGAGKSTLMKIVAGLIQPSSGLIMFEGGEVTGPNYNLIPGHPGIAYLSQHFELRNHYRMEELLEYANTLTEQEANALYELCEITHLLKRKTEGLSGGERQRIALAKLLVSAPRLLLLDEPFSNLDLIHKSTLKKVLNNICNATGLTCMLTSHDPADTLSWADELLVMQNGSIIQRGTPEQVYRQPSNEYVAGLLGAYNLLGEEQAKILGIQANGRKMVVRPEAFKLSKEPNEGIEGVVARQVFAGSSYEQEVLVGDSVFMIRTQIPTSAAGDSIWLSVSPNDIWYID
jgi:iron(III) transport system ATP-binding protein